jgi:hypothetical protein
MNPNKQEGGIMNCFLDNKENIIAGQDKVLKNCLSHLSTLTGVLSANDASILRDTSFPDL